MCMYCQNSETNPCILDCAYKVGKVCKLGEWEEMTSKVACDPKSCECGVFNAPLIDRDGYYKVILFKSIDEKYSCLDDFFCWYDWSLCEFEDGHYDLLDTQVNHFKSYDYEIQDEDLTLDQMIKIACEKAIDYWNDEEDEDDDENPFYKEIEKLYEEKYLNN